MLHNYTYNHKYIIIPIEKGRNYNCLPSGPKTLTYINEHSNMPCRDLMQQSHHQGIFPGSTRFNPVQSLPVRPGIVPVRKHIFAVPSSRFITVFPGGHTSTPGLINQDHPGGHPVHPGGHPVHHGQHTVDTRFIPVDTKFIPVNTLFITVPYGSLRFLTVHYGALRFLTVHYGALRFITVHPGQHTVNYGSLRCLTVHYGNSDHPGQHQVHYGSLRFIPVNTRFFQVNTRFEFSPRFDAGSTDLSKHVSSFKMCSPVYPRLFKVSPGWSRVEPGWTVMVGL